jgi:uncharacterized membrane protein
MSFCNNCGKQLGDNETVCSGCGTAAGGAASGGSNTSSGGGDFNQKVNAFMDTPDSTSEYDPADIEANKFMALLAYLGILFLVPLLAAPNSKFARYHANQGIILFIGVMAVNIAVSVVFTILSFIKLGFIGGILYPVCNLVTLAFMIIGVLNAYNGRARELPIIGGKITILK